MIVYEENNNNVNFFKYSGELNYLCCRMTGDFTRMREFFLEFYLLNISKLVLFLLIDRFYLEIVTH